MDRAKVACLTTRSHPLLPYQLERFRERAPSIEPVLVLDARDFAQKDRIIFERRTLGAFPTMPMSVIQDYERIDVESHNGPACREALATHGLGLALNAGTPRLLSHEFLSSLDQGVVNVHPGILPKYRGATCPEWAVYHDDPVGVTAHFMDARLDAGPILFTRKLSIAKGTTYAKMRVALYLLAIDAMVDAVRLCVERSLHARDLLPQEDGPAFKPIPEELLGIVEEKLASGSYAHAR